MAKLDIVGDYVIENRNAEKVNYVTSIAFLVGRSFANRDSIDRSLGNLIAVNDRQSFVYSGCL